MAEAIVSFVVERLGDLLLQEITFLRGVHGQFERLQNELKSIIGFLKTADSMHNQDQNIRVWVADVRDIAYDVDDVIDAFLLKVASKEGESSNNVLKR
ncbi:Disease resistance protein, partial [Thalictrum thalictroides]